jgi:hypothetical protein
MVRANNPGCMGDVGAGLAPNSAERRSRVRAGQTLQHLTGRPWEWSALHPHGSFAVGEGPINASGPMELR